MEVSAVLLYTLIAILTLVVYLLRRNFTYWKRRGIPHDEPHPLYGNMKGFGRTRNLHSIITDYYKKYKSSGLPFVGYYSLQNPTAFIVDIQLVKNILIKDFSNFVDRGVFNNERDDPLSAHLFSLDSAKWKQLRHKLSSTFTSGKMKFMYPTVTKVAEEFVAVMHELVGNGKEIEIKELLARFTTDVIGTCAFGIECNSLRDPNAEFRLMGKKAFSEGAHSRIVLFFMRALPEVARKLRMRAIHEEVSRFFLRIVRETVELREQQNIKRNDFMDILVELKNKKSVTLDNGEVLKGLTMNEVAAQAFVFFLAGFETSSSTMTFALYELACHQDIQNKLRAEINETLAKHNQQFSYECMKDLSYYNQVISETLRLHTIVAQLDRKALNDYVVPGNPKYIIESGTSVVIPATAIHKDPDFYPDPDAFKPERFTPELVAARDSVKWLPFGDGPRNCIGMRFGKMQSLVGLAVLIKNFKFSICDKTPIPIVYDPQSFILSPLGGMHLRVEKV